MRFVSVAERELRAGARQKSTHRMRWITASVFLVLLAWLMWVNDGLRGPKVFHIFSVLTFFYCLFVGAAQTADCLSLEKREGTMGLLFLTNLTGPEIIAGKLCSSALAAAYGLFAIFPLLALQMLIGGITLADFWQTVLALAETIFFSAAAGFLASSLCVRQFTAVAMATGLALFFSLGFMGAAASVSAFRTGKGWNTLVDSLAILSPLYALVSAQEPQVFGRNHYWWSVLALLGMACLFLGLSTWQVSSTWRDRPVGTRRWATLKIPERWRSFGQAGRLALRRRLLSINPFFWLGGRNRVSAPVFMLLTLAIAACASFIAGPYFARVFRAGTISPVLGQLFAWMWAGLLLHALVLYYAAMTASRRLAEDKQTGALELVLSTPASEASISRGLWMAYGRRMLFPATAAILVHFFFLWMGATAFVLEPSIGLPSGTTPAQLLWHVFLNEPIAGVRMEWGFVVALRILLLLLVLFMLTWITLGWVARWLGLRMKHPGFAPMVSLALLITPPIFLFSFACYVADKSHVYRLSPRIFIPLLMWVAFGIGAGHFLLLSLWAAGRLRREFRLVVTSRFQPRPTRRWWLPNWRLLLRLAIGGAAFGAAVLVIVLAFYGYQTWHSRHVWSTFQKELSQRKESLDVASVLPPAVPDAENFALTPAFRNWANPAPTNESAQRLFKDIKRFDAVFNQAGPGSIGVGTEWAAQGFAPLHKYLAWASFGLDSSKKVSRDGAAQAIPSKQRSRDDVAQAMLKAFQRYDEPVHALAEAAHLPYFQISTNQNPSAVLREPANESTGLQRLHVLLQARASAFLAVGCPADAAQDLLTTLQLARLARQIPDTRSAGRVQVMLVHSLQPLWEGMVTKRWTADQLASFQTELSRFNLLADYTNAVRRAVLANIQEWRAIAEGHTPRIPPPSGSDYPAWQVQPRAWWLDNCTQLYEAGNTAIRNVDVAAARVYVGRQWPDLEGLPLDQETSTLLQQPSWSGVNAALVTFSQTAINQAIIACALERFRLAHDSFPEKLDQLVPAFLASIPNDIVIGRVMAYQNLSTNRFILRSVGPNEKDDRKNKSSDDWLWAFPTNAPAKPKQ